MKQSKVRFRASYSVQRLTIAQMSAHDSSGALEVSDLTFTISVPVTDEEAAHVNASSSWRIPPVIDVGTLEALPPAAKHRETKKAADTFASTGRNIFVHYVSPILAKRREMLLASGTTKKKYPRTAAQLWSKLSSSDSFFWHQAAKELRLCMKQSILNPKGCLVHAGRMIERDR